MKSLFHYLRCKQRTINLHNFIKDVVDKAIMCATANKSDVYIFFDLKYIYNPFIVQASMINDPKYLMIMQVTRNCKVKDVRNQVKSFLRGLIINNVI